MWSSPLLYERLTWPEVRFAAEQDRVCLIPVATLEDHGPHLPIDTDLRITAEICRRVAEAAEDDVVLLPAIPHGYSPHHMDFPGAITIGWDTFTRYLVDVGSSLARHGFRRMLFLNGHGSNQNLVEMAARLVGVEYPDVLAAAAFYLSGRESARLIEKVRDSSSAGWRTPASSRRRSTWPSTRRLSTWRRPSTSSATASPSTRTWTGATGR